MEAREQDTEEERNGDEEEEDTDGLTRGGVKRKREEGVGQRKRRGGEGVSRFERREKENGRTQVEEAIKEQTRNTLATSHPSGRLTAIKEKRQGGNGGLNLALLRRSREKVKKGSREERGMGRKSGRRTGVKGKGWKRWEEYRYGMEENGREVTERKVMGREGKEREVRENRVREGSRENKIKSKRR